MENLKLETVEQITKAIDACGDNLVMRAVLEQLRLSKKREIELLEKAAKKGTNNKFTETEQIIKAIFVAVRPHVDDGACDAVRAFKAAVKAITDDFSCELQEKLFSSSTVHCSKSNFNKAPNIDAAYKSYKKSATQAAILLPDIAQVTWDKWLESVGNAAQNAATRRAISWTIPDTETDKDTDKGTTDKDTDKGTTDKKIIITSRKKRK